MIDITCWPEIAIFNSAFLTIILEYDFCHGKLTGKRNLAS